MRENNERHDTGRGGELIAGRVDVPPGEEGSIAVWLLRVEP